MTKQQLHTLVKDLITDVPDFPQKGIVFKDITPLLRDKDGFKATVDWMAGELKDVDYIVSPEARGFIFGTAVAYSAGAGFIPLRKPGKLPRQTFREAYGLEYGNDELQMHIDALPAGSRVAFVDDVLATGGTLAACERLVKSAKAELVKSIFLLEIDVLSGRNKVSSTVDSLIHC
ncbi:adenine phosphoribosyltransferase [Clostridia bacterium]|nr:adenine phosphoribosyltransferase [Clostridia bacterium]